MQKLLTAAALGKFLGLHRLTVLQFGREGKIPIVKLSARTIRFNPVAVEAALNAPTATPHKGKK